MKFKNYQEYMEMRNAAVDNAQQLIDSGNIGEEYTAAINEITNLDNDYETYAAAVANLNAINGTHKPAVDIIKSGAGVITDDIYASADYRKAFMNYVIKGTPIAAEYVNQSATTSTSDVGALIPTTVLNKIIEKIEATGIILPLVTRTAYKGGLTIPTSTVKPVASWVAESAGSDTQKKTAGTVTFSYHKLRCAVAVSLETDTMALSAFETALINNVSEAMTKAIETAIVKGSGTGQPKGILTETAVTGQNVDITSGKSVTYDDLCNMEAKLPLAYEAGAVWCMTKATFMKIMGMVDTAGQPIARINYGIGGKPERTILGRTVVLNDYMASFAASVSNDTVIAFLFDFKDYVLNTNLNITMKKYEDNTTDDIVTKAIMLVDGKVIDKNSLVTMTLKKA